MYNLTYPSVLKRQLTSRAKFHIIPQDYSLNTSFASNAIGEFSDLQQLPTKAVRITSDCQTLVQGINAALNMLSTDKEGTLLLNSYIAGYFPNKNYTVDGYTGSAKGSAISGVDNSAFAGACVEYAFSGTPIQSIKYVGY